jgi:glycogen debranching enzyme
MKKLSVLLWLIVAFTGAAQQVPALHPIRRFQFRGDALTITRPVEAAKPFTVAGERGAIFGEQNGMFEAWIYPVKILSGFRIAAELADYPVPIDVNALATVIEVTPAMTTITYSHAAFTVKQRMFAGPIVIFEIDSIRPLRLTFRFKPEMLRMWPASNFGAPNAEWVSQDDGGYYILHTDNPDFSAVVAMPRAQPGILPPYQERPQTYPLELKLSFDPKNDSGLFFPLLMTLPDKSTPVRQLADLNDRVAEIYAKTQDYYAHFFDTRLSCDTPDAEFDRALRWAAIAIDQGKVRFHDETGLVAGYYTSADSARPGYGWFFGRDALWTSYAVNSYGDFDRTRQALDFLIHRQRADGKIMHEYSQTADLVDWKSTPYFYAAADSTPLFVMAMEDYINVSGDLAFLRRHWEAVKRAYSFTRAHDSDGDGIYENSEGTGWVESWPQGMPHQEIYLATLDQQSADAMSRLATLLNDQAVASQDRKKADEIRAKISAEYYAASEKFYAFSRNADGSQDHTATIFPSVAWWSGRLALPNAEAMLTRWASPEFSTDWGTRDIGDRTPFYDPISYHQGSVWPLFTGWVSLAEYRAGRSLSGYAHLMQNANLTWIDDPGAVTELLSGAFFQPLGRSSSHQVWSSAMVLTPALRGLFGLDWNALDRVLRVAPNLPATWDRARLHSVPFGDSRLEMEFVRDGARLIVRARSASPEVLCLVPQAAPRDRPCRETASAMHELVLQLPAVEIGIPSALPSPGSRTSQLKAIGERRTASYFEADFEAPGGTEYDLPVRLNRPNVHASGAELSGSRLHLRIPAGSGYQTTTVRFTW